MRGPIRYDRPVPHASWRPPGTPRLVAFSPGLAWVAVLDRDGRVELFAPFGGVARTLHLKLPALALALADDGATLAAVDAQRRVHLVHLAAPSEAHVLPIQCGRLVRQRVIPEPATELVSIAPHQLVLAAGTDAVIASEQSIDDDEEYYGGGWITSSACTTLTRWRTGAVRVLQLDDATVSISYSAHDKERAADHAIAAAFSPDGLRLALLSRKGRLALYDREGGPLASLEDRTIRAFAFLPGEPGIVTASGARVVMRDLAGRPRRELSAPHDLTALACSPCGTRLAGLDVAGGVTVLDAVSGAVLAALPPDDAGSPRSIAWPEDHLRIRGADDTLIELRLRTNHTRAVPS